LFLDTQFGATLWRSNLAYLRKRASTLDQKLGTPQAFAMQNITPCNAGKGLQIAQVFVRRSARP
jgi:hypothetical protein